MDLVLSAPTCFILNLIQSTEPEISMVITNEKLRIYLYVFMCVHRTGRYQRSFLVERL